MTRNTPLAICLSLFVMCASAFATSGELLNFIGIGDMQSAGAYYDGGTPGIPNYGVTFSSNFMGLRSILSGGSGNFSPTPLGTPAIFITGTMGTTAVGIMNVAPGFSNGINFYYSALLSAGQSETVTIWSGTNGTGTVLATIELGSNDSGCGYPAYCNWSNTFSSFGSSTAHSVTFTGPADQLGLADITIGSSTTAIPEPSSMLLLGTGLFAAGATRIRKFFGA